MKIISLNIGQRKNVNWRGKNVETGIYKHPVLGPLYLGKEDVKDDIVVDRKYHGGIDKACYLFSADHYPEWKKLFPKLDWGYGMFGENITVENLNESEFFIGDILRIGGATVQISQPRQPCFKLGIRFGTQTVLKKFIHKNQPGIYVRILDSEKVHLGDSINLIERPHNSIRLMEVWNLLYGQNIDDELLQFAIDYPLLGNGAKETLRKIQKGKLE